MAYYEQAESRAVRAVRELAHSIKSLGFRPFIAANGKHGFYTDEQGSSVVSFQHDLHGGFRFSGNYVTDNPHRTGTGWVLEDPPVISKQSLQSMLDLIPPRWAVGDANYRHATLEDHQERYQRSSKYEEYE